jgi:hypothetical protein
MPKPVEQILPGVVHWTATHPNLGVDVSSYLLTESEVLIDPMLPPEGLEWFGDQGIEPREIVLSSRHHLRDAALISERYGASIRAPRPGMHEFAAHPEYGVAGYDFGEVLAGGVVAHEVNAISPDETALEIPTVKGLVVADGVVNYDGLRFVPDHLMGDDPESVKRGLRARFAQLIEEVDFDHLLCAHGDPVIGNGRTALRDFVANS